MSQPAPVSVIALTDEPDSPPQSHTRLSNATGGTTSTRASRLPRFSRDVIDLEDDSESFDADEETQRAFEEVLGEALGDPDTPTDENGSPDSPDVEILWSRPSETAPQPAQRQTGVGWHASLPRPGPSQRPLPLDWRRLTQPEPSTRMLSTIRNLFRLNDDEARVTTPAHRLGADIPFPLHERHTPMRFSHTAHSHQYNVDNERFEFSAAFQVPGNLQYDAPAFVVARDVPTHSALPLYEAPAPPRPGYTRSASEDHVMVCPNCDEELGIGDTELQRQVWIVKKCGHVRARSACCERTLLTLTRSSAATALPIDSRGSRGSHVLRAPNRFRTALSKVAARQPSARRKPCSSCLYDLLRWCL